MRTVGLFEVLDYEVEGVPTGPDPEGTRDICAEPSTASPSSSGGGFQPRPRPA
jgi:hypothetical protein